MKNAVFVSVLMLVTACTSFGGPGRGSGSPGYIEKGESLYDGKRFAKLVPASLFDVDNTPGVFRIGLVWDERYGDRLHMIAAFPLGKVTSTTELSQSTKTISLEIDGKAIILPRVKNSIKIVEDHSIGKEYAANIKYKISRQTIKSMLSATRVVFRLQAASKIYKGDLFVPARAKNYYADVSYTAINGLKRFYKEIWGEKK